MIHFSSQLQTFLYLGGYLVAGYFAYRLGKNKYDQDTISGYKEAVAERDLRLKDSDVAMAKLKEQHLKELTDLKAEYDEKIKVMQTQIDNLIGKAQVLEGVVTGKENFDKLQKSLDDHDKEVDKAIAFFTKGVADINSQLATLIKGRREDDKTSV